MSGLLDSSLLHLLNELEAPPIEQKIRSGVSSLAGDINQQIRSQVPAAAQNLITISVRAIRYPVTGVQQFPGIPVPVPTRSVVIDPAIGVPRDLY
jgi:hypothetical protein